MDYVKAARASAKLAVRYGPQAKLAWDRGGKQAATAAQKRALAVVAARKAYAEAETVRNGSVLKHVVDGSAVYVVFADDQPVHAYPPQETSLEEFVKHADLTQRVTAEEHRERALLARAKRLRDRARRTTDPEAGEQTRGAVSQPPPDVRPGDTAGRELPPATPER
jgi:hypothetical protein